MQKKPRDLPERVPVSLNRPVIVYFSGTGGTETAALELRKLLSKGGRQARIFSLDRFTDGQEKGELQAVLSTSSLLFILYPVHAGDAPLPVYEWLEALQAAEPASEQALPPDTAAPNPAFSSKASDVPGTPVPLRDSSGRHGKTAAAAVFSVSGGGSMWPNNDCRRRVIRRLERKGAPVLYERMLVMPTNWTISTPAPVSALLLKALPHKLRRSLADIENGTVRRNSLAFGSALVSWVAKLEHKGARRFGRKLSVNDACNGCGWCARSCPRENIGMKKRGDGPQMLQPDFDNSCILCMRCIYGCPQGAIEPGFLKFMKIENGFSLPEREEVTAAPQISYPPNRAVTTLLKTSVPGMMWKGVRSYLSEEDG